MKDLSDDMKSDLLKLLGTTKDNAILPKYLICSEDLEEEAKNIASKINNCVVHVFHE